MGNKINIVNEKKSDFPHTNKFKLLRKVEVYSTNFNFFLKFIICVRISLVIAHPGHQKSTYATVLMTH